ncbi:MAG: nickel-binding protein [Geminicoccaceae bacterium]
MKARCTGLEPPPVDGIEAVAEQIEEHAHDVLRHHLERLGCIYCIYIAPDEAAVRAHGQMGGFPVNRVAQVLSVIDPTTAEAT